MRARVLQLVCARWLFGHVIFGELLGFVLSADLSVWRSFGSTGTYATLCGLVVSVCQIRPSGRSSFVISTAQPAGFGIGFLALPMRVSASSWGAVGQCFSSRPGALFPIPPWL